MDSQPQDPSKLARLNIKAFGPECDPEPRRTAQWARFPVQVGRQGYKIGGSAALVYMALLSHAFSTKHVWPSHARLVELTGLCPTSVKQALKRLRDLRIIRPGPMVGRTNSYYLQ